MKITCPVCSTSYVVPDTSIGPQGRKVKCANCAHSWHQDSLANPSSAPTVNVSEEAIKQAAAPGANVPARVGHDHVPKSLIVKAAAILLIAIAANNFSVYSESIGFYSTESLAFNDIALDIKREENKLVAYVTGEIKNESEDKIIKAPDKVHFKLWSGQKRVMAETTYDLPPDTMLNPGDSVPFSPRIGNISGNAEYLVIDLGNDLERTFRE